MNIKFLIPKIYFLTIGKFLPTDVFADWFPVSVKGIVWIEDKVVLLKNERGEWDLPGGKLANNETLSECLFREVNEELGIICEVGGLASTVQVRVKNMINVVVIIYNCTTSATIPELVISSEHAELGCFSASELGHINILPQYREAILQNLK